MAPMRRFEFIGGTSAKFWEIGQAGAEVTVRFGRLGTNGQAQTKDLGSEHEAADHVGSETLEAYARYLIGSRTWMFWWD